VTGPRFHTVSAVDPETVDVSGRIPPQHLEAEQAVLGAILLDHAALTVATEHLKSDDFYFKNHRLVFESMAELAKKNRPIDILTLAEHLTQTDRIDAAGGVAYVASLSNHVASAANLVHHAEIVREKATLRKLIKTASEIIQRGYEPTADVEALGVAMRVGCESLTAETRPRGFRLVPITDIHVRAPVSLVQGVHARDTLALLYGDSGVGKSVFAVSLAYAISTGRQWFGRRVTRGPVVYIAGEGQSGIRRRFAALEQTEGVPLPATLYLHEGVVGLVDTGSVDAVVAAIASLPAPPVFVVLDTLARTFGPGDENSTEDMSAFVAAVDRIREAARGATVEVIHHTGLTAKDRARGSYALHCGVDDGFELARRDDGRIVLTSKKSKDTAPAAPMSFRLRVVELLRPDGEPMQDEDGELVTSCVLDEVDEQATVPPRGAEGIVDAPTKILRAIARKPDMLEEEIARNAKLNDGETKRHLKMLVFAKKVGRKGAGKKGDPYRYFVPTALPGSGAEALLGSPSGALEAQQQGIAGHPLYSLPAVGGPLGPPAGNPKDPDGDLDGWAGEGCS